MSEEDITDQAFSPFPVTVRILAFVYKLSTDWSLSRLVYDRFFVGTRSTYVECLIVGRLGVLIAFLFFFGFRTVYHLRLAGHPRLVLAISLSLIAICIYILLETCSTLLRLLLLHRYMRRPPFSPPRTLILGVLNVLEATILFAAVYQFGFYLYPDLQKAPPLNGSVLEENLTTKEHLLYPTDALYFSFVTITTLGYGDIVPSSRCYRLIAFFETITGILLIVIMLAFALNLFRLPATETSEDTDRETMAEIDAYLSQLKDREMALLKHSPQLKTKIYILYSWACFGLLLGVLAVIAELVIETLGG